jgi:hypothetical protein
MFVTTPGGKPRLRQKGETITIGSNESVLLESPGHIGVLVLGDDGAASLNTLKPRPADEWLGEVISKKMNTGLNEIVSEMNDVASVSRSTTRTRTEPGSFCAVTKPFSFTSATVRFDEV